MKGAGAELHKGQFFQLKGQYTILTVSFLLYAPRNQTDLNNIYSYDVIGQPVSHLSTRSFRRHYELICEVKQRLLR